MSRPRTPRFEDVDRALTEIGERMAVVAVNHVEDPQPERLAEAVAQLRRVLHRLEESTMRRLTEVRHG